MNPKTNTFKTMLLAASFVVHAGILHAAPFPFNDEDLVLGFRVTGGNGTSKNVFFNLGNSVARKNNPVLATSS